MTPLELARLSELAEKATPGRWYALHVAGTGEPGAFALISSNGIRDVEIDPHHHADAAFIAAFDPTTAKALLSEIAALRGAAAEAIRFLNVLGDPIAAYLTLVAALEGEWRPKPAPVAPPDPATPCTCGHRRDHHTSRDVDDVVGWPCLDCRSKRCRGFAATEPAEREAAR